MKDKTTAQNGSAASLLYGAMRRYFPSNDGNKDAWMSSVKPSLLEFVVSDVFELLRTKEPVDVECFLDGVKTKVDSSIENGEILNPTKYLWGVVSEYARAAALSKANGHKGLKPVSAPLPITGQPVNRALYGGLKGAP